MQCDWAIWVREDEAFIAVHVNNIAAASTNSQLNLVKTKIEQFLKVKDLGPISVYLGMSVNYDLTIGIVFLSQEVYARKLL